MRSRASPWLALAVCAASLSLLASSSLLIILGWSTPLPGWRYRLTKLPDRLEEVDEVQLGTESPKAPSSGAPRRESTVLRIVRDTRQARRIKELYGYRCQMCGRRLEGLAGPYAEAAHIRPLGTPHHGPDTAENLLCLCPNHHVLFDHGGVGIGDDFTLIGAEGKLLVHSRHRVSEEHLRYRRQHYQTKG